MKAITSPVARGISIVIAFQILNMSDTIAQHIRSPEVHPDGSVTFRLSAKNATSVLSEIAGEKIAFSRDADDDSLWTATTNPLPPGIHDYTFDVDGTRMIDPSNRNVKKWFKLASMVEIPGNPPLLTEFQDVPHGVVQRLIYPSKSTGHPRPVVVYTPPGYSEVADTKYPLIILMHGFGDDEMAWTEVGRAHLIADNLLAQQRIRPSIIAMPYGHPVPAPYGKRPDDYFIQNNDLYEKDVMDDLLPFLEDTFKLQPDAQHRSLVGLSMGGGHAIHIGLKHVDRFTSIGAFSAAAPQAGREDLSAEYPAMFGPEPAADKLTNFWIPIGRRDFLMERNEKFVAILKQQGVRHTFTTTEGGHSWTVWRQYLPQFLEMAVPGKPQPAR